MKDLPDFREEVRDYAILLLDADGNILNWNPGAEYIKGYKAEEIIGKSFKVFYTLQDREEKLPDHLLQTAINEGRATHEGWRVKKDGTTFWGSVVITALHDEDNTIIGFSKVTRDLTERKHAEELRERTASELENQNEKLRRSEERYHRMVSEVADYAIILLDTEGNIMNWNKGAENIKGYSEEEIIGKNFRSFYLPQDRESGLPDQLLAEAIANNNAKHEGWRIRKDGSQFWGSIVITSLHDNLGKIIGFSKVTRDLTEQKQSQDYIVTQNRMLQEFAYVASHDLQEPLRKIILFSNMIERDITNEESILKYLSKIINASERMTKLINGVLDYSKTTSTEKIKQKVDLNVTFKHILEDFDLLIQERNAKINFSKLNLPTLQGIPIQLHQLFANLIGNALKYNEGMPIISISHEDFTVDSKNFVKISVADNGIGFDSENAEKIFTMFHRISEKNAGTGIGLALCRRIAESHGGSIVAESNPGKGSVFEVVLLVE